MSWLSRTIKKARKSVTLPKDLSSLTKAATGIVDPDKMLALAKRAGPGIALVYPPAAPLIASGLALAKAAESTKDIAKSAAAKAKIAKIIKGAANGVPEAKTSLAALQAAGAVREHVRASPSGKARVVYTRAGKPIIRRGYYS